MSIKNLLKNKRVILASASPRRMEILKSLELDFRVIIPEINEKILQNEKPRDYIKRVSLLKCKDIKEKIIDTNNVIIIAADTIVVHNNKIIGKSSSLKQAREYLITLSGTSHKVLTAITIYKDNAFLTKIEQTIVNVMPLTNKEIDEYLETKEYKDKAGAYAIQGLFSQYISDVKGCFYNVIGLPVNLLYEMLIDKKNL
jgi:septum formation protein